VTSPLRCVPGLIYCLCSDMCCAVFVADDFIKFFSLSLVWTEVRLRSAGGQVSPYQRAGTFLYHTTRSTAHSDRFAQEQVGQRSPLFCFAVSRGPRVSVRSNAESVRSVRTTFVEGARNVFRLHAGTRVYGTSKFCKLSEPTGSEWRQLSD
jgi:hypothetical protein